MRDWGIAFFAQANQPVALQLDCLTAEVDEFYTISTFLRDRNVASTALRSAIRMQASLADSQFAAIASIRNQLRKLRVSINEYVSRDALVAFRIFVPRNQSMLFISRFDEIMGFSSSDKITTNSSGENETCGSAHLQRASSVAMTVADELAVLVSSGQVRISKFEAIVDQLRSTVRSLSKQRTNEELAVVGHHHLYCSCEMNLMHIECFIFFAGSSLCFRA